MMVVVDRRHAAVEHGGEVKWVQSRRCWGATSRCWGAMSRCLDVRSPLVVSLSLLFSWGVIHLKVK